MKLRSLFFLFLFFPAVMSLYGQNTPKDYTALWKRVEEHISKGLPQSALAEVNKIYDLAKQEKQEAQQVKALVYRLNLESETQEGHLPEVIAALEKEIAVSEEPVRSILYSLAAGAYQQLYQSLRWRLLDRTDVAGPATGDPTTWSAAMFLDVIGKYYLKSVENEAVLQQTGFARLEAIITKGTARNLRPTLYDLLAHRALDFFSGDERTLHRPAYVFEIDQPEAFASAEAFASFPFRTMDSLSLEYKALLLYQKLLSFHLRDSNPEALIDADLQRITYVYGKSVHPDKEQLYTDALQDMINRYNNAPAAAAAAAAQASLLLAHWHYRKAGTYNANGDTTFRYSAVKALEIAESVAGRFPDSEGGVGLHNLKSQILTPSLAFNVEKVSLPGQPFLISLQYRNTARVYFRLIKATENLRTLGQREGQEKLWAALAEARPLRTWEQALPDPEDHQLHRVELHAEALPAGEYFLIASGGKNLRARDEAQAMRLFYVSGISCVNQDTDYFVLHRDTGAPLEGAVVQIWERKYLNRPPGYQYQKGDRHVADKNGHFRLAPGKERSPANFRLEISHESDVLFIDESQYTYFNGPADEPTETETLFFFTDRAIYRPGQTVYFKGILLKRNSGQRQSGIVTDKALLVRLFDANAQAVDSVKLTTNEFGSVSGTFQLPASGLNGQFRLAADHINGGVHFNVEEYKRPRYKVIVDKPEQAYLVHDTVTVTGNARAFAGNNIDGASVRYRVERVSRFPYPWFFRGWFPVTVPMQVTHGETVTDAEGKFEIRFSAIPDKTVSPKTDPLFDYTVYVEVTDANGETRTARQSVSVGYKSIVLKADIPVQAERDSLKSLSVRTENSNGIFVPAEVALTIRKLLPENRLIRERRWERPDQFIMSKTAFLQWFPHDEYDDESRPEAWEKGDIILSEKRTTVENGQWALRPEAFPGAGFYEITLTATGKNGESVQDIRRLEVTTGSSGKLTRPQYIWSLPSKPVEPGQEAVISLGTAAEKVFLIRTVDRSAAPEAATAVTYEFTGRGPGIEYYAFRPTEEDSGGYGIGFLFVKHNRVHQFQDIVKVSWSNKELQVRYGTFRDKTLPGSEETWTLTIEGNKGEKLAAELLAGMYDASLDEFIGHRWITPGIWPVYFSKVRWDTYLSFNQVQSQPVYRSGKSDYKVYEKRYDQLIYLNGAGDINALNEVIISGRAGGRLFKSSRESAMAAPVAMEQSANVAAFDRLREEPAAGDKQEEAQQSQDQPTRKDFRETAFFYPVLRTDPSGAVTFSFTLPEALTRWKFQAFAHTKALAMGYGTYEIVTQKDLMVQPNIPRFVRAGDAISVSSKLVNLSGSPMSGNVSLQIVDAATLSPLDGLFSNLSPTQTFQVPAGQSATVTFPVSVPGEFVQPVILRVTARSGDLSDGEEHLVPVLTNRMLVTETVPLAVRGTGTRSYRFEKLLRSAGSSTLRQHGLTVEYTANPAWNAVQALPYLMEYPYDCAEQTWNRYYANALAAFIANRIPRIAQVFETWRTADTSALLSNLQKNQELKSLLLEETPWVLEAQSEAAQRRNIGLLFDLVKMKNEAAGALDKLRQMQLPHGAYPWFKGGPDDRYVTQYIVTGIGHLYKLTGAAGDRRPELNSIVFQALEYLDAAIQKDYEDLVKYRTDLKKYVPSPVVVQYLYMRSFFPEYPVPAKSRKAVNYFTGRLSATWTKQNKYLQAMTALALARGGNRTTPAAILKSLKETAIRNPELGTYWKQARRSWWWQEAPIEQHALFVEAFEEIALDAQTADDIRTWLLSHKRTNRWESTKATAEACYALLLRGSEWLADQPEVKVRLGDHRELKAGEKAESGTGYFKESIPAAEVEPAMGKIEVKVAGVAGNRPSWGSVYWQYFEDLDKITFAETPLKLKKQLFREVETDRGRQLRPVGGEVLKVGDKLIVRIELAADRDMEYVHMKDMRASGLEPLNVLSGYKWQGGLSYYETTRDAGTSFFFHYLPKGNYVFEYPLHVTHQGDFSNGIATIQCMYAPEFTAHTEGSRLHVQR